MTSALQSKIRRLLIAGLITCCVVLIGLYWINLRQEIQNQRNQLVLSDMVAAKSQAIERRLDFTLMATRMLATQVRLDDGRITNFPRYAKEILATVQGVDNIQLAPDGVITHIYPISGNEKALGHDILMDDDRRDAARKAISTGKMTMTGPFNLIQGGVAVIGRQPVFLDDDGRGVFWGFASALIYLDELLKVASFKTLEEKGYAYQLSRTLISSGKTHVFARSEAELSGMVHQEVIQVPNSQWVLEVSLAEQGFITDAYLSIGLLAILAGAIFLTSLHLLKQPEKLKQQIEQATQQLSEMAFYDQLTGLANRRLLFEHIQNQLSEMQRHPFQSALLYIDLDNFKDVNDNLGHDAGDELLRIVASKIRTLVRDSDIPARIGGDEFSVLIKKIKHSEDAALVAEKIITNLNIPISGITEHYPVTASIGIVLIPQHCSKLADILKCADQAMYQAKNNGKNRYYFYSPNA